MSFESFAAVRRDPAILKAANAARLNESELEARIRAEADGNATWARHAPGIDSTAGDHTLQVDVALAVAAAFVLTP